MMFESWLLPVALVVAVKSSILVLLGLFLARHIGSGDLATRLWLWRSVIVALLVLPFLSFGLPSIDVALPGQGLASSGLAPDGPPLAAVPQPAPSSLPSAPVIALTMFLSGVLVAIAAWIRDALRLRRWRRESRQADQPPVPGLHREIRRALGLDRTADVRWSKASPSPLSWGWRRPRILLPEQWQSVSADDLRAALAHELAHVQRKDWLWLILSRAVSAFYWCNPLVGVIVRRLAEDTEVACDRLALSCGLSRGEYARTLVRAAAPVPSAALAMAVPRLLERRIESLLTHFPEGVPMNGTHRVLLSAGLLAVLLPLSACSLTQASEAVPAAPEQRPEAPMAETVPMPSAPPRVASRVSPVTPPAEPAPVAPMDGQSWRPVTPDAVRPPRPASPAAAAVAPAAPSARLRSAEVAIRHLEAAERERLEALRDQERAMARAERAVAEALREAQRAEREAAQAERRAGREERGVERHAQRAEVQARRAEERAAQSEAREAQRQAELAMMAARREALMAQDVARLDLDRRTEELERELAMSQERVEELELELERLLESMAADEK